MTRCNEVFRFKSSWKLAAGNSAALDTLESLLNQCGQWLNRAAPLGELRQFALTRGVARSGRGKPDETRRFRLDAATGWTALDVGWSLHDEGIALVRPWVELLAVLGIQSAFPPPARNDAAYHTWAKPLPLTLARLAARGLLPSSADCYHPRFVVSGQNDDAYPSTRQSHTGAPRCPQLLTI